MAARAQEPCPECHICLEELRRELAAAPCGHVFHHECALQALRVRAQCPICRRRARGVELVALFLELPAVGDGGDGGDGHVGQAEGQREPPAGEGEARKLSARVNALMERVQWQKRQGEALAAELKRLRGQNELLARDKQTLALRAAGLEGAKAELLGKVGKYQLELSRQAEAARRMAVNQSIAAFLDTCDADALEDEIQNPRELIIALKKACKFRHEQYQKVVKDKARLKSMLDVQQAGAAAPGKAKSRSAAIYETKRSSPMDYVVGAPTPRLGAFPTESKKRKIDATTAGAHSLDSVTYMPAQQMANTGVFTARAESAGYRANAYSDVPVRPVTAARQTFGRSSYNTNQYGAYQLTPANDAPVGTAAISDQAVCRRGYDETGKLTNFFLPKQPGIPSHAAAIAVGVSSGFPTGGGRQKAAPSMRNLLNDDNYAPAIVSSRGPRASDREDYPGDRREYTLTSWLRRS